MNEVSLARIVEHLRGTQLNDKKIVHAFLDGKKIALIFEDGSYVRIAPHKLLNSWRRQVVNGVWIRAPTWVFVALHDPRAFGAKRVYIDCQALYVKSGGKRISLDRLMRQYNTNNPYDALSKALSEYTDVEVYCANFDVVLEKEGEIVRMPVGELDFKHEVPFSGEIRERVN